MPAPTMIMPVHSQARSLNELYGYPTTSQAFGYVNTDGEVHMIFGTDADPSTNHANAPNGSHYTVMTNTAGSMKLWIKFGATFGAKDGTWKATSALT